MGHLHALQNGPGQIPADRLDYAVGETDPADIRTRRKYNQNRKLIPSNVQSTQEGTGFDVPVPRILLETCRPARRDGAMRRLAFPLWLSIHGPFANAPTLPQRVR